MVKFETLSLKCYGSNLFSLIRCYTSSILNRWATLVLAKNWARIHQILHFPKLFWGEPRTPLPINTIPLMCDYHHYPTTALHNPASIPPTSNDVMVFLYATIGGLLPTFCKGSSTLFHTKKGGINIILQNNISTAYNEGSVNSEASQSTFPIKSKQ